MGAGHRWRDWDDLGSANQPRLSEELLFRAIGQQRKIVEQARKQTRSVKAGRSQEIPVPAPAAPQAVGAESPGVDYSKPVEPYRVEIWE